MRNVCLSLKSRHYGQTPVHLLTQDTFHIRRYNSRTLNSILPRYVSLDFVVIVIGGGGDHSEMVEVDPVGIGIEVGGRTIRRMSRLGWRFDIRFDSGKKGY